MKTIRDIMTPDPISVGPDCRLRDAIGLLIENEISGLPVVSPTGRIVGVLSEADLLRTYRESDARTVADLMTPNPTSIGVDDPLVEVVDCIMANDFRRILIHERGRLVGVVSRADLMPAILDLLLERHPD